MIKLTKKQYPPEIKMQIVKEAMETGNASIVARKHDISASLVNRWVRNYKKHGTFTGSKQQTASNRTSCSIKEYKIVISENEKLKKLLGEKDLEIEILRDLLKKTNLPLPTR